VTEKKVISVFEIPSLYHLALWPDGATPTTVKTLPLKDFDLSTLVTYEREGFLYK